nr:hypothetical protein [Marivita sp.]
MSTFCTSIRSLRPRTAIRALSLPNATSAVSVAVIRAVLASASVLVAMPGPQPISRIVSGANGTIASARRVASAVPGPHQSRSVNTSMNPAM